MVNKAGAPWVPEVPEVQAGQISVTGMKELWATGSSWGADRCWCWQIERVIIQSLEDELVLVLAGSPCSRITPNHTSINQVLILWHSLKTALLSKDGHAHESVCHKSVSLVTTKTVCAAERMETLWGFVTLKIFKLNCELPFKTLFFLSWVCNAYLFYPYIISGTFLPFIIKTQPSINNHQVTGTYIYF